MQAHRVAITGLGAITALGHNVSDLWRGLSEGRSGIAPLEAVDTSALRIKNAAEVRGFNPLEHFDEQQIDLMDRCAQLCLVAAREAIDNAGIEWTPELKQRTGVVTGCSTGGQSTQDVGFQQLYREGKKRVHPLTVPRVMANAGASHICMKYGLMGPTYTFSTACASSNHALGSAFHMVRNGMADVVIAGGNEAPFSFGNLKAWEAIRVVAPDTCRPFSKNRAGLILGEGGAMMVLEPLNRARDRGARIYAEFVGFGMSADAHHITQPSPEGAARAINAALQDAGIAPEAVGYVNAHGTGTLMNDATETQVLHAVFGKHINHLAVSSTKSMHGHALGATGAIKAIATTLALHHGILPPTANFTEADVQCDLDVIPNQARRSQVEYAISNALAFGGLNAILVFRRWQN